MTLVFQMNGDNPRGVSQLKGAAPAGTLECTVAQKDEWLTAGPFFPGTSDYQFTYIADVLTQLTDVRPTATWGHTPGPGAQVGDDWEFELNVGDAEPTVTITLSANLTDNRLVKLLPSGHHVSLDFVSGVTTVTIKTDKATSYKIDITEKVRFTNRLVVLVSAPDLYAV